MEQMTTMGDFRAYLQRVTAIQNETIRRLVKDDATPPLEVAAVLEDIANLFLDLSDEIREFALGRQGALPTGVTEPPGEADRA